MTDAGIRLVIVTDDAEKAAPAIFGLTLENLPRWVLVMTDWQAISRLAEGTPCMAIWFPKGRGASIAEQSWTERRQQVKLDDDYGKHEAKVNDWLDKRAAAERAILAAAIADRAPEGAAQPAETVMAAEPSAATPRKSKWS